jgi:hypothetical protein
VKLVQQALAEAGVTPSQISLIAFTKVSRPCGPGSSKPTAHRHPGRSGVAWLAGHLKRAAALPGWHTSTQPLHLTTSAVTLPVAATLAGPRHGRPACVVRRGGAHAVAAVAGAHRGREPLRGAR